MSVGAAVFFLSFAEGFSAFAAVTAVSPENSDPFFSSKSVSSSITPAHLQNASAAFTDSAVSSSSLHAFSTQKLSPCENM